MHVGLYMFVTDYTIGIQELARAAEARGFESLFVPEHTHIPASRRTPFPSGGPLPRQYAHTLDPFVALAAAAAVTTTLRLGTGIALLTERDPIVTAKAVATLDLLSGGRFLLGIGAGWNAEEMEHHGTAFATRFRVMDERARAMQAIWTQEEAAFHGAFVRFEPLWSYPKPVQRPHPPILIGGESEHTRRRVVEYGNGWFPRGRAGEAVIRQGMADLRARAERAGRDPDSLTTTVFGAEATPAALDRLQAAGVARALLALPPQDREATLPLLDDHARLLRR